MQINNRRIELDRHGEGEAMLLVHGLGGTSNFWRPVVSAFSAQYSVIAPDLPSAGRSELDPQTSIESLAADMLALLDGLEIERAHLVGHSMGTIVCQHMAARAPERVTDMVLLGPLAEPPDAARTAIKARADAARAEGMTGIADVIADVALAAATKSGNPNAQGFVREMLLRQPPEGYALSCEALAQAAQAKPETIKCRSLLITGDEDAVAPEANVRKLAGQLEQSEMQVLSSCGHWTLTEQPAAVVGAMQSFYS
ncbi:MAG: alpha/beta fold hydrolase [Pseudomonadota bacterium]